MLDKLKKQDVLVDLTNKKEPIASDNKDLCCIYYIEPWIHSRSRMWSSMPKLLSVMPRKFTIPSKSSTELPVVNIHPLGHLNRYAVSDHLQLITPIPLCLLINLTQKFCFCVFSLVRMNWPKVKPYY